MALSPELAAVLRCLERTTRDNPKSIMQLYLEIDQWLSEIEDDNDEAGMDFLRSLDEDGFVKIWQDAEQHNVEWVCLGERGQALLPRAKAMAVN